MCRWKHPRREQWPESGERKAGRRPLEPRLSAMKPPEVAFPARRVGGRGTPRPHGTKKPLWTNVMRGLTRTASVQSWTVATDLHGAADRPAGDSRRLTIASAGDPGEVAASSAHN
jgi:hypothetical protein